jgi:hypothetical protein
MCSGSGALGMCHLSMYVRGVAGRATACVYMYDTSLRIGGAAALGRYTFILDTTVGRKHVNSKFCQSNEFMHARTDE